LGTKDFVYSVRDGNTLVDVDVTHIDDNSFDLISTGNITSGVIVLQAKI
jgi:hypothetical protein